MKRKEVCRSSQRKRRAVMPGADRASGESALRSCMPVLHVRTPYGRALAKLVLGVSDWLDQPCVLLTCITCTISAVIRLNLLDSSPQRSSMSLRRAQPIDDHLLRLSPPLHSPRGSHTAESVEAGVVSRAKLAYSSQHDPPVDSLVDLALCLAGLLGFGLAGTFATSGERKALAVLVRAR